MASEAKTLAILAAQTPKKSQKMSLLQTLLVKKSPHFSELFAMGPVQFSWPRGGAENSFTKPGFWEYFVDFSQEKQQNTEFTKFSLVRTPEIY